MLSLGLRGASTAQLNMIIGQAEKRLEHQIAFAAAADQRAAIVGGAATSLAAAALAIAAQKMPNNIDALAAAAMVACAGFWLAALFALRAARCFEFHPSGYRPRDFVGDVSRGVSEAHSLREICADLDGRLDFNADKLSFRGRVTNLAMKIMIMTPIASTLSGALFLVTQYVPVKAVMLLMSGSGYSNI